MSLTIAARLLGDLLALEPGEALQAQIEDRLRLLLGEAVGAVLRDVPAGLVDEPDEGRHVLGGPCPLEELRLGDGRVLGGADDLDHLVDVGDRDREADQHMRLLARLAEEEARAALDHLLAEGDEGGDEVAQRHHLGTAEVEREHVDAEGGLKLRVLEELVDDDLGRSVALQLDDDAHAFAVALVPELGDPLDRLVADEAPRCARSSSSC